MKWSKEVPAEPGYYWFRRHGRAKPEIVRWGPSSKKGSWLIWFMSWDIPESPTEHNEWGERIECK